MNKPCLAITRSAEQNFQWAIKLKEFGFDVVEYPLTYIQNDDEAIQTFLKNFSQRINKSKGPAKLEWDGLFFSSENGWDHFWKAMKASGYQKHFVHLPCFTLSPKVLARATKEGKTKISLLKSRTIHEVAKEAITWQTSGQKWLHPCSTETRLHPELFMNSKLNIENFCMYRTAPNLEEAARLIADLDSIDGVLFAAGSAAAAFANGWTNKNSEANSQNGASNWEPIQSIASTKLFGLGASVFDELNPLGLDCIIAEKPNFESLILVLKTHFKMVTTLSDVPI